MRKIIKSETNEPGYIRKVFYSAEDKCWVAIAPEIPGCSALGDTDTGALTELDAAIKLHLRIRKENKLPIIVFNMKTKGNLKRVVMGELIGSRVMSASEFKLPELQS